MCEIQCEKTLALRSGIIYKSVNMMIVYRDTERKRHPSSYVLKGQVTVIKGQVTRSKVIKEDTALFHPQLLTLLCFEVTELRVNLSLS